jgi:outer membrane protein assembly factor BamE (lipoprotein component of BamABCDE complex)
MKSPYRLGLAALLCLLALSGCVQFKSKRGVEVSWLSSVVDDFQLGQTTRAEVLKELGPPSQIISLQEETVLYYLYEKQEGEGAILLVYNRIDIDTRYDRAVFFFDGNDRLKDYATKTHAHDDE